MRSIPRSRRIVYAGTMLAIGLSMALVIAEITVRIVFPQPEIMKWFVSDERYGYVLKPNFTQRYHYPGFPVSIDVRTNAWGLRDREFNLEDLSNPDVTKILLVGDSFTFGQGVDVDETFAAKLGRFMSASKQRVQVINAGVGGWGTLQEVMYSEDHFALFRPDVLVLTFCGNDPDDDTLFMHKLSDQVRGALSFPGKEYVREYSQLWRFLQIKLHVLVHNALLKQKGEKERQVKEIDMQSGGMILPDEWQRTSDYLHRLHLSFQKHNPNGVLLVQATAPWNEDIRRHLASIVLEMNDHDHVRYVDLYERATALKPADRRLPYDGHWSSHMHTISAEALRDAIQRVGGGLPAGGLTASLKP